MYHNRGSASSNIDLNPLELHSYRQSFAGTVSVQQDLKDLTNEVKEYTNILQTQNQNENEMNQLCLSIDKILSQGKIKMRICSREFSKIHQDEAQQSGFSETSKNIRKSILDSNFEAYKSICNNFKVAVEEFETIRKTKLRRELETYGFNKQQIEDIICLDNITDVKSQMISQGLLAQQVVDIEYRNIEIKKLEKSVLEIANLFNEVFKITELNGQIIDHIGIKINLMKDHVLKAEEELNTASRFQCMARKRLLMLILIVFIILIILVAVLLVVYKP
jgi:t-SNARE complex subunit (syntaxin)